MLEASLQVTVPKTRPPIVPQQQTRSFLMRRFEEAGISPQTRHGQNFLIDLNLLRLLHRTAAVGPQDVVLEVGTGTGALTGLLAADAGHVITVEIDPRLFQLASEELAGLPNVTMLHTDALRNKNNLSPDVLAAVREQLSAEPGRQFKLAANLPYNIATPIITNALALNAPPRTMTVTIQKEVADRILAAPSSKDYGSLSVWVQSQCRATLVRVMPPDVFWPRPKVSSAIVHLELDDERRQAIPDLEFFHRFVREMFFHRRKFLRGVAVSALKKDLSKGQVDEVLAAQQLGPTARTEELSVEQLLALCEAFRAKLAEARASSASGP
jgi:16S rRNA (adenine1518-N6/adenine1519-N6)-dimethyltransferase